MRVATKVVLPRKPKSGFRDYFIITFPLLTHRSPVTNSYKYLGWPATESATSLPPRRLSSAESNVQDLRMDMGVTFRTPSPAPESHSSSGQYYLISSFLCLLIVPYSRGNPNNHRSLTHKAFHCMYVVRHMFEYKQGEVADDGRSSWRCPHRPRPSSAWNHWTSRIFASAPSDTSTAVQHARLEWSTVTTNPVLQQ